VTATRRRKPPAADTLRRSWSLATLLAALSMLGPFSVDMYLPAFPAIGSELRASPIALQQTLSAYLFAFAFMMLWHGALSDALGRRPVVLGSLAVFAVATLGCAIAGNIESLWLFRALQGMSSGAGVVVGRAIIRDRFDGAEAQRLMSQITLVFGIAPAVAPVLGGLLLNVFGWRSLFWVLLALALGVLAWAARALPETLPPEARHTLHPQVLWRSYRSVLLRIDFLLLALIPALNFCAFFLYIASAPAFLIDLLGVSSLGFAWLFVPMILGVMVGALMSGRLAGRASPKRTIRLGYAMMFAGVAVNLATCSLVAPGVPWNVLPIMLFTLGSSLAAPSITLLMLDLFPVVRGMASSLQGFVQFSLSGVVAGTVAPFLAHSVGALALGMTGFTLAGFALWLVYQWRAQTHLKGWHP
jgi:DHA1 family bicyclomycin/chloramphenicol resistance-like MFS transporter